MNPQPNTHLTEEALDDLLIGMGSPAARRHVASCQPCHKRVAAMQSSIEHFNQASLAWSESKAAPISRQAFRSRSFASRPLAQRSLAPRPLVWTAATAALLLAVAASWNLRNTSPSSAETQVATQSPAPASDYAAQIDEDNQLLLNVSTALNDEPSAPLSEFATVYGVNSQSTAPKARTQ